MKIDRQLVVESLHVPAFARRSIRIALPPDHEDGIARPLVFFFDGQNGFGDVGSYAGGWFWIDDRAVASLLSCVPSTTRLYLDGGANESKGELAPRALKVVIDLKGTHDERSWRRRLPAALRWFHPLPSTT